jgi:hypothetical protein
VYHIDSGQLPSWCNRFSSIVRPEIVLTCTNAPFIAMDGAPDGTGECYLFPVRPEWDEAEEIWNNPDDTANIVALDTIPVRWPDSLVFPSVYGGNGKVMGLAMAQQLVAATAEAVSPQTGTPRAHL